MVSAETEAVEPGSPASPVVDALALSGVGTEREHNEDARGIRREADGAVEAGELTAVHVGDSRLYLVRDGLAIQSPGSWPRWRRVRPDPRQPVAR